MTPAIKNILVPVDFSSNSARAVDYAVMLARQLGALLHFVHVCDPASMGGSMLDAYAVTHPTWNARLEDEAEDQLAKITWPIADLVASSAVLFGDPASRIVRAAQDRKVDLIVMGTHGRGAIMHMLMGSVAKRVVRIAPCPVMTVREPVEEAAAKAARSHGGLVATMAAVAVALGATFLASPVAAQTVTKDPQQRVSGSEVYRNYCAACHGASARGDGPLAASLRRRPTDLAEIAKRNGGLFPTDMVYRTIDGRQRVRGHGGPDMPVWGDAFKRSSETGPEAVKQRIDSLVEFLESIQIKPTQ